MAEGEFWKLIEVMGGQADDDAVARLTESLATRRRKDVLAFQERLARVLYDLDREVLAVQPVRFTDTAVAKSSYERVFAGRVDQVRRCRVGRVAG